MLSAESRTLRCACYSSLKTQWNARSCSSKAFRRADAPSSPAALQLLTHHWQVSPSVSRTCLLRTHAKGLPDPDDQKREAIDARARVRSEVLAPFRLVRLVLFGFFALSASIALAIALTQLVAAIARAPDALPIEGTLQGIAIDITAITVLLWLFRRDWQARKKQIARLTREETLGALQLELSNKKTVLVAGTPQQVAESVARAEPLREQLEERAVFVVPLPVFSMGEGEQLELQERDLKFKGLALRQNSWKSWFEEQLQLTKATPEKGLYISLRMDGRVRASGTGSPPWERFVRELPPNTGAFQGMLDGMDGKVNAWK